MGLRRVWFRQKGFSKFKVGRLSLPGPSVLTSTSMEDDELVGVSGLKRDFFQEFKGLCRDVTSRELGETTTI